MWYWIDSQKNRSRDTQNLLDVLVCSIAVIFTSWGPFIFYEGGGPGGIWEAPFKNRMTPLSLPIFSHGPPL